MASFPPDFRNCVHPDTRVMHSPLRASVTVSLLRRGMSNPCLLCTRIRNMTLCTMTSAAYASVSIDHGQCQQVSQPVGRFGSRQLGREISQVRKQEGAQVCPGSRIEAARMASYALCTPPLYMWCGACWLVFIVRHNGSWASGSRTESLIRSGVRHTAIFLASPRFA